MNINGVSKDFLRRQGLTAEQLAKVMAMEKRFRSAHYDLKGLDVRTKISAAEINKQLGKVATMNSGKLRTSINKYKALGAFKRSSATKVFAKLFPNGQWKASKEKFRDAMQLDQEVRQCYERLYANLKACTDAGQEAHHPTKVDQLSDSVGDITRDQSNYSTGDMFQALMQLDREMKLDQEVQQCCNRFNPNLRVLGAPIDAGQKKYELTRVDQLSDSVEKIIKNQNNYLIKDMKQKFQLLQKRVKTLGEQEYKLLSALENAMREGNNSDLQSSLQSAERALDDRKKLQMDIEAFKTEFNEHVTQVNQQKEKCVETLKFNFAVRNGKRVAIDQLSDDLAGIISGRGDYLTKKMKDKLKSLEERLSTFGQKEATLFRDLQHADGNKDKNLLSDVQSVSELIDDRKKLQTDVKAFQMKFEGHVEQTKAYVETLKEKGECNANQLSGELSSIITDKDIYLTMAFDDTFQSLQKRVETLRWKEAELLTALNQSPKNGDMNAAHNMQNVSELIEDREMLKKDIEAFKTEFDQHVKKNGLSTLKNAIGTIMQECKYVEAMVKSDDLKDFDRSDFVQNVFALQDILSGQEDCLEVEKESCENLKSRLKIAWDAGIFIRDAHEFDSDCKKRYEKLCSQCQEKIERLTKAKEELGGLQKSGEAQKIAAILKDTQQKVWSIYKDDDSTAIQECFNDYCDYDFKKNLIGDASGIQQVYDMAMKKVGGSIKSVDDAQIVYKAVKGAYESHVAVKICALTKSIWEKTKSIFPYNPRSRESLERDLDNLQEEVNEYAPVLKSKAERSKDQKRVAAKSQEVKKRISDEYKRLVGVLTEIFGDYEKYANRNIRDESLRRDFNYDLKEVKIFQEELQEKLKEQKPTRLKNGQLISSEVEEFCETGADGLIALATERCNALLNSMVYAAKRDQIQRGFDPTDHLGRPLQSNFG